MRALPLAAAVWLAVTAAPALAAPPGAPGTLRVSRAGDERAHPRARTEQWDLQAVDPATHRAVLIRLRHAEGYPTAIVTIGDGDGEGEPRRLEPNVVFHSGTAAGARFDGPGASARLGWSGRRVALELSGPEVSGRVMLAGRPGPFAARWRLGEAFRYPQQRAEPVRVGYDVPVARGRVSGSVTALGRTLRLDGWRGSFEHVWGSFAFDDRANWAHWDAYAVHRRHATWLAFGMNRRDAILGPGARDAQWLGVLARVDRRGTRVCRPRIDRRRWAVGLPITSDPVAYRLGARCRGLRATFADRALPGAWLRDESYIAYESQAIAARVRGSGFGVARHDRYPG
jgi:hypothetical protein